MGGLVVLLSLQVQMERMGRTHHLIVLQAQVVVAVEHLEIHHPQEATGGVVEVDQVIIHLAVV